MRTTRASAAIGRLNARDTDHQYSFGLTPAGLFYLLRSRPGMPSERISDDMAMDEFVELVNRTGPQKKVRVSRLDQAFEQQLKRSRQSDGGEK